MIRVYFLLLVFCCLISFQASAEEVIVVKAESGDATPRLQAAIEKARAWKGNFVSNTTSEKEDPDPTKHIALWMKEKQSMSVN